MEDFAVSRSYDEQMRGNSWSFFSELDASYNTQQQCSDESCSSSTLHHKTCVGLIA